MPTKSQRKTRYPVSKDPFRQREQQKYPNPIPSREFIMQVLKDEGRPLVFEDLAPLLGLESAQEQEALQRRLGAMMREGQLLKNRKQGYCLVNRRDLLSGRVIGHADGHGFLRPDDGGEDVFLSASEFRSVFHGDRVVVSIKGLDRRGRPEGVVVEVLERNTRQVVGRFFQESGVGFVVPDQHRNTHDIIIPKEATAGAKAAQIVVAEITEQPTRRTQPIGRILEILGDHMSPGMAIDMVVRDHGLPTEWSEEVLSEAARFAAEVPEAELEGRLDLRHLPLVTIDGEDARDFDDAVYCERKPKGWRLLVCIADVAAYVKPGTALDAEARARGNSVYFPNRVIPMLPEALSNGLCSLNPDVDRLCMVCELYVGEDGSVRRSAFHNGVMRSQARLTYTQVASLIYGEGHWTDRETELLPHLLELYQLYQVLLAQRQQRGAIEFDGQESRFLLDDQGRVSSIVRVERNEAHRLIEECMLAANVAAARWLTRKLIPAIYRNHEGPTEEKLKDLRSLLGEMGLNLEGGNKPVAGDYERLLRQVQGRPDETLIQTLLLRSMSQAMYGSTNLGHFGLAYPCYTHFTSPIRRYPDLLVHRAIKHLLAGGVAESSIYTPTELQTLGEHCSATERRADEASREVAAWMKCEYMQNRVGDRFRGVITSVNGFGIFVGLDEVHVDGLLHITSLDNDFFHFDPLRHKLVGERTGKIYRLGDPIEVQLAAVNLDERKIDFVLPKGEGRAPKKRRNGARGGH